MNNEFENNINIEDFENDIEYDVQDSTIFSDDSEQKPLLKVNEFEYGYPVDSSINKFTQESKYVREVLNNPLARKDFYIDSVESLLTDFNILKEFIDIHSEYQNKRHGILENYYEGKNVAILHFENRRRQKNKSDNRVITPFARTIVDTHVGYTFSNNINIQDSDKKTLEFVNNLFNKTKLNSHNKRLATDMFKFGHAYEINYRNKKGKNIVKTMSVYNTFMIYTNDLEKEPICGVHYILRKDNIDITLYFDDFILYLDTIDLKIWNSINEFPEVNEESIGFNGFGGVPIIEFKLNDEKLSVFEPVISLIDAHDAIMSDIINVSNDTPDALLKIKGVLSQQSLNALNSSAMKDANAVYLEPGTTPNGDAYSEVDASYMTSNYDVNANKTITDMLSDLIYTQSSTPNFSDDSFGSATSGIVMQYRLYGTETVAEITQTQFKEGLIVRYELWANLYKLLKDVKYGNVDISQLDFVFVENVPVNIFERFDAIVKAGGKISNETLLSYLPNTDYKTEMNRLNEQNY